MTTLLISAIFQGSSTAQAIAADDLVKQCPSAVPEAVCQPNPATMQQHIEKDAVSSTRGEGKISGKRVMLRLHGTKYNILSFFLKLNEIKCRHSSYYIHTVY